MHDDDYNSEFSDWKQAACVEAGLRREFLARAEKAESERDALVKALAELTHAARFEDIDMRVMQQARDILSALSITRQLPEAQKT